MIVDIGKFYSNHFTLEEIASAIFNAIFLPKICGKYMKIKFNLDDDLLLNKILEFRNIIMIVRIRQFSVKLSKNQLVVKD